jgi:hypothetical protein
MAREGFLKGISFFNEGIMDIMILDMKRNCEIVVKVKS